MKRTLTTCATLLALAAPAAATDIYSGSTKDTPIAPLAQTWTGVWFGIGPSYDGVKHNLTLTDGRGNSANLDGIGGEDISFLLAAGANWQLPGSHFVVGFGGDYKFANAGSSLSINNYSASYKATDAATAWGRLGYAVNPNTLAYFKGGYGWVTFQPGGLLGSSGANLGNHTFEGGLVGGGIETRLDSWINGLTARLEYTYLGANDTSIGGSSLKLTDSLNVNSVNLVFAWNFGGGYVPLK